MSFDKLGVSSEERRLMSGKNNSIMVFEEVGVFLRVPSLDGGQTFVGPSMTD